MRALWLLLAACAASPPPAPSQPAPVTDGDPRPYVPPAAEVGFTGGPVGLRSAGGAEQARSVALRFVEAALSGDEETLAALLAPEVVAARTGRRVATSRDVVLRRILESPRRRAMAADDGVEALVDFDSVRVQPLDEHPGLQAETLEGSDWVVTFTFRPPARRLMFLMIEGWRYRGTVIVRTGEAPRVVGL